MSSGVESLTDETINDYAFWALKTGLWNGRIITLEEVSGFFIETKSRIEAFLFSQDPDSFDFKEVAVPLAWIGSQPQERLSLLHEIEELRTLVNGAVVPAKNKHKDEKKDKFEDIYDLDRVRKLYDQKKLKVREILTAAGLEPAPSEHKNDDLSFWEEHGRQILVAIAIVAIVAAVIAVSVSTAGATSGVTIAAAGGAISGLQNALDEPKKSPQTNPVSFPPPNSLAVEPISIPTQINDLANFSVPIPSSVQEKEILSSLYNQKPDVIPSIQPSAALPLAVDILQASTSSVPWMNESISYLQWRERQLQEELLATLLNNERTVLKEPTPVFSHPSVKITQEAPKEPKLPIEIQQTLGVLEKSSSIQQFVELIEKKLGEPASPDYIAKLQPKDPRPDYTQQFVKQIEEALRETADPNYLAMIADPNYLATMQVIEALFPKGEISGAPIDNYASSLSSQKPAVPFQDVPLLGRPDQSTVHFHCGISNNFSSIVGSGLHLKDSLDNKFAVQPHLVHSNNIVSGLTFVGLEKVDAKNKEITSAGIDLTPNLFALAGIVLENSYIQRSIDYEVESLSQIAQNIIKTGNPNLKQLHVTFSNGGHVFNEALKQLPPEYRETIVVITTGTTAIIDEKLAHKVYNIIGDKDWPSLRINGVEAIKKAQENGILEIIHQNETQGGIGGHYSVQPDYQKKISDLAKKRIVVKYEIY